METLLLYNHKNYSRTTLEFYFAESYKKKRAMHVEIHFSTVRFLKIKNANYGYKYLHLPMNS